ncbi:MAG: hypothetical protein II727_00180, partial [Oscillospiraceae bacterium]|nr:hypothetical protein [Oscillospiraceae bacterium]
MLKNLPLWGAEGTGAGVNDSPVGCQSRAVTEPWVAGSAGSAAAGETGGFDAQRRNQMRSFSAQMRIPGIRHPEGVKRPRQSVSSALPISCKSADLQDYLLCFLSFRELRFLPLWEESSKEAHEGGE